MDAVRRVILKGAGASGALLAAIAAGVLKPAQVLAAEWNKNAFNAADLAGAMKGVGIGATTESKDLIIKAPEIAENGAVVPVEVVSNIPNTQEISVFVEKNPLPLAASFHFANGADPQIAAGERWEPIHGGLVLCGQGIWCLIPLGIGCAALWPRRTPPHRPGLPCSGRAPCSGSQPWRQCYRSPRWGSPSRPA